jgi:hypothetical protein
MSDIVLAAKECLAPGGDLRRNGSEEASLQGTTEVWWPPLKTGLAFEPEVLNQAEAREREECESIIRKGWDTFLEVGRALARIRQRRLYRDKFQSFEEYCRRQWDFSKTHANRLIEAAAVADVLTPIGVKVRRESHVRALVWLPPQKIVAAWKRAEELAGDGEVNARVVRQAVEELREDNGLNPGSTLTKKLGLNRVVLHSVLKLIERAESAAREKDTKAVLEALADLRQRLLDC